MGGTGKKSELPGKDDGKSRESSRKSPPATAGDDDLEDGEDDQPL